MKKIYIQKDSYLYIIFILLAFHGIIDDLIMLPQYTVSYTHLDVYKRQYLYC